MGRTTDFPGTTISRDPDEANYQNYLAWQQQIARRRRESSTQFSVFQYKAQERLSSQVTYKEELQRESDHLKDIVERRLSQACDCGSCGSACRNSRSNSDSSIDTTNSQESSPRASLCSMTSTSPPGTTVRGPTSPSSKNSLIVSPPPRSRHHQRRRNSLPPS